MTKIPRPEHPRPQFERKEWINLNGSWSYTFDFGKSGMHAGRELYKSRGFKEKITVPFCPESKLSGVGHTDFIEAMWYHRTIKIPASWRGKRTLLHFGAVDHESEVFIDGVSAGTHFGGTSSFSHEITRFVTPGGRHHLVVRVRDDACEGRYYAAQPRGKQSPKYQSHGCHYTRTTGIWQTVWLEAVGTLELKDVQIVPDYDAGRFVFTPTFYQEKRGTVFSAVVLAGKRVAAEARVPAKSGVPIVVDLDDARPWSPEDPFLYDVHFKVEDEQGRTMDEVCSYAGLRKVHIEGNRILLNNEPIYQRLVLDQGFYPTGVWTAPTDRDLKRDIELSLAAGFTGARLHQKVFEERFHYWADKLGYLTWAESSSWGCDYNTIEGARNFISEWQEIVIRDRNHPSIITWTPFNESIIYTNPKQHRRLHIDVYETCRILDPTRPVNDASGHLHQRTDLWTVHTYEQDARKLKELLTPDQEKGVWRDMPDKEAPYEGQPYLVDEFGGIKWTPERRRAADASWGYGDAPGSLDEFYERLAALTDVLLGLDHVAGYCYTQLTDVEQEQNGIYNYDRSEKFDMSRIQAIFGRQPSFYEASNDKRQK